MKKGEIMNEIVLKVPASLRLMSLVRSTIKNYLEIEKVSNSEISKLLSVVDELATNAVEHGYDYDEKDMLVIRVIKETTKIVIEVEAGRGYRNNQFLKDIFQACMMPNVEFLVIAVRNHYHNSDDFKSIFQFLETLYISGRLQLPLKGIVLIGY